MKNILYSTISAILLLANSIHASDNTTISDEENKQLNQVKETKKKGLSEEDKELIAKFMESEKELKDVKKLGETLDKVLNKIENVK